MDKKYKILIIIPRYNLTNKVNYSYAFPLGLGYISSALKKEGYEVDCLNLNHYKGTVEELVNRKLNGKKYDFVCTGNNALGYAITEKIINSTKKHKTKPRFILGGPIITSEPETVFKLLNPDFAVIGEGEETIIELLKCIKKGRALKKVKGLGLRNKNGEIIFTEKREPIKDLDSLPWPDFEGLEFEKKLNNLHCNDHYSHHIFDYPRVYILLASRSCPFQCTFCYHDSRYRQRSLNDVMRELNTVVKRYKINMIVMCDECFSVDKKRMYEFCKRIKKLREEISWDLKWSPQITVHNIDKEMLKTMKDAGVDTISYGFESYSPIVLKSMRKPITPEMINRAFHETLKAGIGIQANFIFGDVAETKETAQETLGWWKKNCKGQVGLGFIQPYPGSEIYKHCLRRGIIKDKIDFIKNQIAVEQWYNMTDKMTNKEVKRLRKEILNSMSKYCKFVKPVSMKKMKNNIYEFTVKCPFCGKINDYKNCYIKNKWTYGFYLICRYCHLRFFIVSFIQRLAYKNYNKVRTLRDYQKKLFDYIKKRKL